MRTEREARSDTSEHTPAVRAVTGTDRAACTVTIDRGEITVLGDTPRRRMRSAHVAIGVTAMAAAALTGCSSSPDYAAVCVDEQTQERVSDYECDDDDHDSTAAARQFYIWYYLGS